MFELKQLEQLLTIADSGTISKAAERLHLSQPALSRSIQRLEEELKVSLFDRQKNKITLNKNGEFALGYAKKIIDEAHAMAGRIQAFEKSQQTISIGSCAPAPIWQLTKILSELYPDVTIQSEIQTFEQLELEMLNDRFQIMITTKPFSHPDVVCQQYLSEHLYVALPLSHPFADYKQLSLSALNGQSILILSNIGFWYDICKEKMPDSMFLVQEEMQALDALRKSSTLPFFVTNLTDSSRVENRILIPLIVPEVNVTFYCHTKKSDANRLSQFTSDLERYNSK